MVSTGWYLYHSELPGHMAWFLLTFFLDRGSECEETQ